MNIFIHADVFLSITELVITLSLFSPQLGIRISLSHEKEPLGTGAFLITAAWKNCVTTM